MTDLLESSEFQEREQRFDPEVPRIVTASRSLRRRFDPVSGYIKGCPLRYKVGVAHAGDAHLKLTENAIHLHLVWFASMLGKAFSGPSAR